MELAENRIFIRIDQARLEEHTQTLSVHKAHSVPYRLTHDQMRLGTLIFSVNNKPNLVFKTNETLGTAAGISLGLLSESQVRSGSLAPSLRLVGPAVSSRLHCA